MYRYIFLACVETWYGNQYVKEKERIVKVIHIPQYSEKRNWYI